jgi:hypothetical protein
MAKHRQRLCRICRTNPVWTHGDIKDSQGTCKRCYHKHVWAKRSQVRCEQEGPEVEQQDPRALWEIGMEAEREALGHGAHVEDLW